MGEQEERPRLTYYVAQTLDGFIAESDGGVEFLNEVDHEGGEDYGYAAFYATVDSLVMGRGTYAFVESAGTWHYAGKPCWVMTSQPVDAPPEDVRVSQRSPREVVDEIAERGCRETWLVGGGKLARAFANEGLLDRWIVSVVPYVMGEGIPLVAAGMRPAGLTLESHTVYPSGLVQLVYRSRAS